MLAVTPGQVYQLMVGGTGSVTAGGFNGTSASSNAKGAGGGGASDVRSGACAATFTCTLADRRLIAGGGGGGGSVDGNGGSGGQVGGDGTTSASGGTAGTGGTATTGGTGGARANGGSTPGTAGQLGLGGDGGYAGCGCGGAGGGGGGLYGGGGGGWQGGGGGGSSSGPADTTFQSGVRTGNGQIAVIYTPPDNTGPVAKPSLSPEPNAAGWNNTNVTVNWNWTDDLSGVDNGSCETSTASNGEGVQTLTAFCADEAGNLSQASYTVKVDRTAPLIQANVSPAANGSGWNNSTVSVSFTCEEQGALSGLATNTVGGNQTFSSEGANFTVTNTGTCADIADNVATPVTVGPINIDLTKPTISAAATTPPNANGWHNSDVTVHFTCADNLSGAFGCPADQTLSSEGTAVSSTAQTVSDLALNSSNVSNVVTIKLDKTAPSVQLTGVTNGATYPFGSVPTAGCSTTDALSGVATQATLSTTGGNGNGTGNFTATCNNATDLAGNTAAPVSVSYAVTGVLSCVQSACRSGAAWNNRWLFLHQR